MLVLALRHTVGVKFIFPTLKKKHFFFLMYKPARLVLTTWEERRVRAACLVPIFVHLAENAP